MLRRLTVLRDHPGAGPGRADPEAEQRELRAYLGDAYDHRRLQRHEHGLAQEYAELGDEALLYRTSEAYLYDLTVFAMSGTKDPYLELLTRAVPPGARLLDYGCGIGSDGLRLLSAGYRVEFADFDNPSTRYLRWRLEQRQLRAPVYDLDRGMVPDGFGLVYALDVIEHVPDPFAFLAGLEARARLVLVNFLEPVPGEIHPHHRLPVADLLEHAAGRGLRRYERHHGRSHVVLYEPGTRGRATAVLGARRAARFLRRRASAPLR